VADAAAAAVAADASVDADAVTAAAAADSFKAGTLAEFTLVAPDVDHKGCCFGSAWFAYDPDKIMLSFVYIAMCSIDRVSSSFNSASFVSG